MSERARALECERFLLGHAVALRFDLLQARARASERHRGPLDSLVAEVTQTMLATARRIEILSTRLF